MNAAAGIELLLQLIVDRSNGLLLSLLNAAGNAITPSRGQDPSRIPLLFRNRIQAHLFSFVNQVGEDLPILRQNKFPIPVTNRASTILRPLI